MFGNIFVKLYLKRLELLGFRHGKNFHIEKGANIDRAFVKIISCGDNVTLAKDVYVLAHDASMRNLLGKTRVAPVCIGDNVFIGTKTVILPGCNIGDNVVIAANSCVTKTIPAGEVWGGCPAHFIMKIEKFTEKHLKQMNDRLNTNMKYVE